MPNSTTLLKRNLLQTFILVFIYLLITTFLVINSSSLAIHIFIVVTVGTLMTAFILDRTKQFFLNIPIIICSTLLMSLISEVINFKHISILIYNSFVTITFLRWLKRKNSEIFEKGGIKIYFLFSVLFVNVLSSLLAFWILSFDINELFAWITATAIGCIVIPPFVISLYNLKSFNLRNINLQKCLKHIVFIFVFVFLFIIGLEFYFLNKSMYYITLVLIVSLFFSYKSNLDDKNILHILFVLFISVMLFMSYYHASDEIFFILIAGVEFHLIILFFIAHFFVQQNLNYINRDEIKQSLIDNGYINMFINLSATKIIVDSKNGNIIDANPAASEFYGYSIEELKKMTVADISYYGLQALERMKELLNSKNYHLETKHKLKNGEIRDVEIFSSDFIINKKLLKHIIIHDITEKKETELELKIAQRRLQSLLSTVSNYTYSVTYENGEMIYLFYDDECLGVTGYEASELNSDTFNWKKLVYPDDRELVLNHFDKMKKDGVAFIREYRLKNKKGEIKWIRNSPIVKNDNGFLMIEGVITDITNQKNIEQSNYKNIIMAQEKERLHFSQELHDGIGPLVSVAKLYTDLLTKIDNSQCDRTSIMNLQSLLNEISQSVREL